MFRRMMPWLIGLATLGLVAGCITVGQEFPHDRIGDVTVGETTQREIQEIFGPPARIGIDDGQVAWTYLRYRAGLFSKASGRDLQFKFENGRVSSIAYNTTDNTEELPGSGM